MEVAILSIVAFAGGFAVMLPLWQKARAETGAKAQLEQLEVLRSATERTQIEHAKLAESIGKDVGRPI